MDPLSLTASILAVLSAASSSVKGLNSFRKFLKSTEDIDRLVKEIEDFSSPFKTIEYLLRENSYFFKSFVGLQQIVIDAESHILELKKLVAYDLQPGGKPSRTAWLFKKDEVNKIRGLLKDTYLRLSALLISLSISLNKFHFDQLGEKFDRTESKLEETSHILNDLVISQQALQDQVKNFVGRAPSRNDICSANKLKDYDLDNVHDRNSSSAEQILRSIVNVRIDAGSQKNVIPSASREGCQPHCDCNCHSKIHWTSPRILEWVFGQLAVNAPEAIIFQRRCNKPACRQSVISQTRLTYKLPLWFIKQGFLLLLTRQLLQGPETLLRMQRVRPKDAEVFYYADLGDVWQLKFLFDTGQASPWDVTPTGETTLLMSLKTRGYEMTKYLLDQGADKDFEDQDKTSAVSYAWYDFLMDRTQASDIAVAAEDKIYELFGKTDFVHTEKFGKLHQAVTGFQKGSLETIIRSGTLDELNALDLHSRTPLFWAAVRGDVEKVRILLQYGASPHIGQNIYPEVLRCIDVESPFDDDTRNLNLLEIADLLQSMGACDELQGSRTHTIIHVAAQHSEGALIIDSFTESGDNFSMRDDIGLTPLDYACLNWRPLNVEMLILGGADVNSCDALCVPSIFHAIFRKDCEAVALLLKAGAKLDYVNIRDNNSTILHHLARWGDADTVDTFIEADDLSGMPDPGHRDCDGETALELFLRRVGALVIEETRRPPFAALIERVCACRVPSANDQLYAKYFQLPGSWPQDLDSDSTEEHGRREEKINRGQAWNNKGDAKVGEFIESTAQKISFDEGGMETDFEEHSISTKYAEDISAIYRA